MILITGGAGYIGSHVAKQLLETTDKKIVIIDNLSTGNKKTIETLRTIKEFAFEQIDLNEFDKVKELFDKYDIDTVIHFAASIVVSESVKDPLKYYMNNTVNTANLVKCASQAGVKKFIFSSTAAVYGEPDFSMKNSDELRVISEDFEAKPINPYGMSKLMSETIIKDSANANPNFKYIIFRYFNVAGADINGQRIGECHEPETHLIPLAAKTALKKKKQIVIYGNDYDTDDGTCIRDYIHVDDLASAHIQAVDYLDDNDSDIFNCGYGRGYSVKEVIDTMYSVTGVDFKVDAASRRAGDPSILISDNSKIKEKMNWTPKYDDLSLICKTAYEWEKKLI